MWQDWDHGTEPAFSDRGVLSSLCHLSHIVLQTNWQKFKASWDTDDFLSNLAFKGRGRQGQRRNKGKIERRKGKKEKRKAQAYFTAGELHGRTKVFWKICLGKMAVPLCISAFLVHRTFFSILSLPEVFQGYMKHYFPTPPTQPVKTTSFQVRGEGIIVSKAA